MEAYLKALRWIVIAGFWLSQGVMVFARPGDSSPPIRPINSSDFSSTWSPDGKQIAFVSRRDGDDEAASDEIYVMNADGSNLRRLTTSPGRDAAPAWSPDGKFISFISERDGPSRLYLMRADGSDQHSVANLKANDRHSWSTKTGEIAFHSEQNGFSVIYVAHPDGSGLRLIGEGEDPVWSPDGTRIAFDSSREGKQPHIYITDPNGLAVRRLTDPAKSDSYPAWSPDGKEIAFISWRDDDPEIYVMKSDGTDQRRLTRSLDWDLEPMFSPDGQWITFNSRRDGRRGVFVMRRDGTEQRKLTNSQVSDVAEKLVEAGPGRARTLWKELQRVTSRPAFLPGELRFAAEGLARQKNLPYARELLEIETDAFPDSALGFVALADVLHQEQLDSPITGPAFYEAVRTNCSAATALYRSSHARRPEWAFFDFFGLRRVARELSARGRGAEALCASELLAAVFPKRADAHEELAGANIRVGNVMRAREEYGVALQLDPKDALAEAWLKLLKPVGE